MEHFYIEEDDKFQSIIKKSRALGINTHQLKVLYCVHIRKTIQQREIERIADLRQPEISIALNQFRKNGIC